MIPPNISAISGTRTAKLRPVHCASAPLRIQPRKPRMHAPRQPDRVLAEFAEESRRENRGEHSAQRSARGDGQIERRQMPRRRPRARQFSVAHHAGHEQRARVNRELLPRGNRHAQSNHHARHGREHPGQHREDAAPVPAVALKSQNERQQVNRQRRDPQKWEHRDLLRDLAGGPQQQHRTAGGERQPHPDVDRRRPVVYRRIRFRLRGWHAPHLPRDPTA